MSQIRIIQSSHPTNHVIACIQHNDLVASLHGNFLEQSHESSLDHEQATERKHGPMVARFLRESLACLVLMKTQLLFLASQVCFPCLTSFRKGTGYQAAAENHRRNEDTELKEYIL
ncbi:hypothetical protein OIU76_030359 [Salix suchowensis]|nr:hypothetical protein OIU76_030359 [Salix suchowensis]